MTKIDWHPSPKEMRRWALLTASGLAAVGALYYFVDWGIFAGGRNIALVLWTFGAVALFTGSTGSVLGLPAYWVWMALVWVVGRTLGHAALTVVFFLAVVPLALVGRLIGRDRLALGSSGATTCWEDCTGKGTDRPQRPF